MKRVLQMALKDLKLLFRDKIGLFFMLGFPVLMGVFFGFIMGGGSDNGEKAKMKVAVIDEDNSEMSQKFVASMKKLDTIEIVESKREEAQENVRKGRMVAMIAVPRGFGETAGILWADPPKLELGLDPSRQAETAMLEGMVMQSIGDLMSARFQDPQAMRGFIDDAKQSISDDESMSPVTRSLLSAMMGSFDSVFDNLEKIQAEGEGENQGPMSNGIQLADIQRLDVTRQVAKGSQAELVSKIQSKWDISFPQSMVWGVLGCVAGFATLTVRERSLGTLTRLQVAPIARWQILAGKGVGCFLAVIGVIAFMMTVGTLLGMRPKSWPLLVLAAVCTAYCFVGIMMLLSLFGKTEQATGGAAWGALTVMAMFGGGMIPVAFMPSFMANISDYDPVKWAVLSVEGAVWRGFTVTEMLMPCGILIAVGTVALAIGSVLISRRES